MRPAPRWGAFLLLAIAILALALPIWYTVHAYDSFSEIGKGLAVATVLVAGFAILTVVVSFVRSLMAGVDAARRNL